MPINHQRRQILAGALAGATGIFIRSDNAEGSQRKTTTDCLRLPADVTGTHTWLALRFVHQGGANACMLAPILPGKKTTTVDDALRYGIFCYGYPALNCYMYLGKEIQFRGAAALVEQPEILFEDFDLEHPDIDVPRLAKIEEDEQGLSLSYPAEGHGASPKRGVFWAIKFRGQTHGSAGFTISPTLAEHLPNTLRQTGFFRSLDEIRLWRLYQIGVDFSLSSWENLKYGCGFNKEELGGMPVYARLDAKPDRNTD